MGKVLWTTEAEQSSCLDSCLDFSLLYLQLISLYTKMSDGILHENVPKFITDVAGFLENDDNNDRIQQLQKGAS